MTTQKRRRGNPKIKELGISTRFQPGQSGNPTGRPKNYVLTDMLNAICREIEPKSAKTYGQLAAEALLNKAFRGDVQAFRELADRTEGKPRQQMELTGAQGSPLLPAEMSLEQVQARIDELLKKGGYRLQRQNEAAQPAAGK
jgi:hypothetical protein